jgi:hypothetical protein
MNCFQALLSISNCVATARAGCRRWGGGCGVAGAGGGGGSDGHGHNGGVHQGQSVRQGGVLRTGTRPTSNLPLLLFLLLPLLILLLLLRLLFEHSHSRYVKSHAPISVHVLVLEDPPVRGGSGGGSRASHSPCTRFRATGCEKTKNESLDGHRRGHWGECCE